MSNESPSTLAARAVAKAEHFFDGLKISEHLKELDEFFKKIDQDGTTRRSWSELARAADLDFEPEEGESTFGLLDRLRRRLEARREEKDLNPLALAANLVKAFLNGPMRIVLSDMATEAAQGLVAHKLKMSDKITEDDVAILHRGVENLHASALYPLSYKYIYRHFDRVSAGSKTEPRDGFPTYPPSEELIALTADIDRLHAEIAGLGELLDAALANHERLEEPGFVEKLESTLKSDRAYLEYCEKTRQLTRMVIGSAATGFLIEAFKSISGVEEYLEQVMQEAGHDATLPEAEYVKMLKEAPAYLRVIIYVAEANNEGHVIAGARIPFPKATSEETSEWLDEMLSDVFGEQATDHPFHGSRRERIESQHPLDVETEYRRDVASA